MKRLKKILFSTRTMTVLLLLFGISMAVATFVENDYDTQTAKTLIYNSTWFEILMLWLIVLFVANIKTYRLLRKEKWPLLLFHLAFIFMFIGGAITRYVSFEGQMPIKEKETTNEIISDLTYFKLNVTDGKKTLSYDKYPYMMSYFNAKETKWPFKRTYKQEYQFNHKVISLKTLDYTPLAKDSVQRTEAGKKLLNIVSIGEGGRVNNYIPEGEIKDIDGTIFSFNNPVPDAVQLMEKDGLLIIAFPVDGKYMSMEGQQMGVVTDSALLNRQSGELKANEHSTLNHRALYTINTTNFIIPQSAFKGKIVYYNGDKNNPIDKNLLSAIQVEVNSGNERDTLLIKGGKGVTGFNKTIRINGLNVSLGFGSKILHTDFSLRCDNFLLDRYPGSNNPSSYESTITVIDKGSENQHHIFMNHVMDYRGYRFFQASYFPDESGTILSVNADRWGTNVTYFGYILLFTGLFFTLFWKGTHFWKLNQSLKQMHLKSLVLLPFLFLFGTGINTCEAQNSMAETISASIKPGPNVQFAKPGELGANRIIDLAHAQKFGHLLVQDFQGRIEPMDTHVLELLRKIYKKDSYKKGTQTISADQWFISMQIDPGFWANEPLIKVSQKGGEQLIRETGANAEGYTSYANLVDPVTGIFKLEKQDNKSFSKRKSDQSNYDKGVIEVTERFNIFSNIAFGYYTQIIPVKNDPAQTWRSWIYSTEENPVEIDQVAYGLLTNYFDGAKEGLKTGNYSKADKSMEDISAFQQVWGKKIVPSASKVNLEILYNHA
ncbi:MAG: cytochrome c biogenesis protein ResB, partial [Ginsengibacter sp.]